MEYQFLGRLVIFITLAVPCLSDSINVVDSIITEGNKEAQVFTTEKAVTKKKKDYIVILKNRNYYEEPQLNDSEDANNETEIPIFKYGDFEIPIRTTLYRIDAGNTTREITYPIGDIEIGAEDKVFETPDMNLTVDKVILRINGHDIPLTDLPKNASLAKFFMLSKKGVSGVFKRNNLLSRNEAKKREQEALQRQRSREQQSQRLCYIRQFLAHNPGALRYIAYEVKRIKRSKVVTDRFRQMYTLLDRGKYGQVKGDTLKCFEEKLTTVARFYSNWHYPVNKVTLFDVEEDDRAWETSWSW